MSLLKSTPDVVPFWKIQFWTEHFAELIPAGKVAIPVAFLWSFLEKAVWGTVNALAISPVLLGLSALMVLLDTVSGSYKALRSDSDQVFSSGLFGRVIDKSLKYIVVIVGFSAIAAAGERGQLPTFAFAWLRDFGYLVVVVREGGSAIENLWGKPLGALIDQFRTTLQQTSGPRE